MLSSLKQEVIKANIKQEIKQFEIRALLRILGYLGYTIEQIHFESSSSLASQLSLCEDIFFLENHIFQVIIVLNIGLLCANSPLPTFFRKKMDSGTIDSALFTRFLSFFDNFIIRSLYTLNSLGEKNCFFSNWQETCHNYLHLIGIDTISSLSYLFQLCFPELKVEVLKFSKKVKLQNVSIALGNAYLGKESFLGKTQYFNISSFEVIFQAEESVFQDSKHWAEEILQRTKNMLFPRLKDSHLFLKLVLVIKRSKEHAFIGRCSYLGYSRLKGEKTCFRIKLYSGYIKDFIKI